MPCPALSPDGPNAFDHLHWSTGFDTFKGKYSPDLLNTNFTLFSITCRTDHVSQNGHQLNPEISGLQWQSSRIESRPAGHCNALFSAIDSVAAAR